MQNIEVRLIKALRQKPEERNSRVIKIVDNGIKKLVKKILRKYKGRLKLNDEDDFFQECRITILEVLTKNDFKNVKCSINTYLMASAKRKIKRLILNEYLTKNFAQTMAISLGLFNENGKMSRSNVAYIKIKSENKNIDMLERLIQQGNLDSIVYNLKNEIDKSIFIDLFTGDTVKEISKEYKIPQSTVYTIMRRRIKPAIKKVLGL